MLRYKHTVVELKLEFSLRKTRVQMTSPSSTNGIGKSDRLPAPNMVMVRQSRGLADHCRYDYIIQPRSDAYGCLEVVRCLHNSLTSYHRKSEAGDLIYIQVLLSVNPTMFLDGISLRVITLI